MDLSWEIKSPPIVQDTIDNEVIIVNLDDGSYYSLDKIGARVWGLIERAASLSEILNTLRAEYDADAAEIETALAAFLAECEKENLIVAGSEAAARPVSSTPGTADLTTPRLPFEPPILNKYMDMQDILSLDPVHEADSTGWPSARRKEPAMDPAAKAR